MKHVVGEKPFHVLIELTACPRNAGIGRKTWHVKFKIVSTNCETALCNWDIFGEHLQHRSVLVQFLENENNIDRIILFC